MLKKLLINGKKIPVPVPIQDLSQAIRWIEEYLLRPDHMITRISLDGKDIELSGESPLRVPATPLDGQSDLKCKIDSPMEICIQTIDALRNLSSVVGRNLKPVAVHLWEYKGGKIPAEAGTVIDDVRLMVELLEHIFVLIDRRVDATNVIALRDCISNAQKAIQMAESQSDWRGIARILLQKIEQPTLELAHELSSLQKLIYEIQADRTWQSKNLANTR